MNAGLFPKGARHIHRLPLVPCFFALLVLLAGCGDDMGNKPESTATAPLESSLVLLGDTSFGENYRQPGAGDFLAERGYGQQLQPFRELFRTADLVIANLETPLTMKRGHPATEAKAVIHWSDPDRSSQAFQEAGMDAFSLANNHAMDAGEQGLQETLTALRQRELAAFGAGASIAAAFQPLVRKLPSGHTVAVFGLFDESRRYRTQYGFYAGERSAGVAPLQIDRFRAAAGEIRTRAPDVLVIAFPHWGHNYGPVSHRQRQQGRQLIEAGADLVVGHGAHMLQEAEHYQGKWILYSIGNFVFNSPGRYDNKGVVPYSLIVRLILSGQQQTLRLYPILSNNLVTDYSPRPVTAAEFPAAAARLPGASGEDFLGYYRELKD